MFFACGLLAVAWNGCQGPDCDCPITPERPAPTPVLSRLDVYVPETLASDAGLQGDASVGAFPFPHGSGARGIRVVSVAVKRGSLQVTGEQVVITYEQPTAEHRVIYDVLGPDSLAEAEHVRP